MTATAPATPSTLSTPSTPSFGVRRVPETAPRIISPEEAYLVGAHDVPWSQAALALDFRYRDDEADFGPQPSSTLTLPDVHPLVERLSQAVMEVVSGQRPAAQLIRHFAPSVYSVVARRGLVAARRHDGRPRRPAVVRRVRVCEPADGVVEACAVVMAHGRVRALAMRLEGIDGRWVVTAITIG